MLIALSAARRVAAGLITVVALTGCSTQWSDWGAADTSGASAPATVRLGFFPNLTHAPALVGVQRGTFTAALQGTGVALAPTVFNAGPDVVTALFANSLDCGYIGPNPAVNAHVQSAGAAIRVVAGAASGGASLVVRPGITSAEDMRGKAFASPQLGNTQDVALRSWLRENGIETTPEGGGDVVIKPQSNAEGLAAYGSGAIDGAWVPEPWVSEYLAQGATVLVDEKTLWPKGTFVTTHIVCRAAFVADHPDLVTALLNGHLDALDLITKDPGEAKAAFSAALSGLTGTAPKAEILDRAWEQVDFTADPLPATLVKSASDAVALGLLEQSGVDAAGGLPGSLYDLTALNSALSARGLPAVAS